MASTRSPTSLPTNAESQFRFPPQRFPPKLLRANVENSPRQETLCRFEVSVDLAKVPSGQVVDVIYEHYSPGLFLRRGETSTTVSFCSEFDAADVTYWFLMPRGQEYRSLQILRYETGRPTTTEVVQGLTEYLADDSSIIAYKMAKAMLDIRELSLHEPLP